VLNFTLEPSLRDDIIIQFTMLTCEEKGLKELVALTCGITQADFLQKEVNVVPQKRSDITSVKAGFDGFFPVIVATPQPCGPV
jgi:hypothetical protein